MMTSLLIVSCNPVKQVLKDKTKFDKVAEEVIRRGYCVNDTIIEVVTDTVYKTDSVLVNVISYRGGKLDTTFADGSSLYMDEAGNVSVGCPVKRQVQKITKTEVVRDKSLENILKRDIEVADSTIKSLELSIKEKEVVINSVENKLTRKKMELWGIILLLTGVVALKLYTRFKSVLPF